MGMPWSIFDKRLPEIETLREDDILLITADHGCDPTFRNRPYREYIPILVYGKLKQGYDLGIRQSFADIGATVAECFGLSMETGKSFYQEIIKG